mmetsp:Transcript_31487/g.39148  ORF Transcript_31487/g.39148 Transcript_31487/m.39148 type:complete len:82 (+) Transcript_31487:608-853(+)
MSPDVGTQVSRNSSFKNKQDDSTFFAKRSTSGLSQGKQPVPPPFQQEPPIINVDNIDNSMNSSSGKKGKKKKKKRGSKSKP